MLSGSGEIPLSCLWEEKGQVSHFASSRGNQHQSCDYNGAGSICGSPIEDSEVTWARQRWWYWYTRQKYQKFSFCCLVAISKRWPSTVTLGIAEVKWTQTSRNRCSLIKNVSRCSRKSFQLHGKRQTSKADGKVEIEIRFRIATSPLCSSWESLLLLGRWHTGCMYCRTPPSC